MDTSVVKTKIINTFESVIPDLTIEETENIQDILSVHLHELTDDGTMIDLDDVIKDLNLSEEDQADE